MGFGLIFIGLISLLMFRLVPIELIGFILIYKGLEKLCPYGGEFVVAKGACVAVISFSSVDAVMWLINFFKIFTVPSFVFTVLEYIHASIIVVFLYELSLALAAIATECGYEKGLKRAACGKILSFLYLGVVIICGFFPLVSIVSIAFSVFIYLFFPFMVYGFYMMIVTDSILEKERVAIEAFDKKFGKKKNKK